ncbi:DNA double-strand break repair and VJ recombination XRCC4 [Purpureocillium lavendulum]|uniref:DNA double-strand break repair and VJ recombination XRCC4 n=1 Tax=Purpureocillium lavendulum TaxID=1247861 RepID=A0AB34FS58_9HYPO|nr:DNA double-strand break repair and VJ recombination XRCC4 [Purpureocillium lavendulum]
MARTTRVIKFPRSDDESTSVLVQVTSSGRHALDVKLVATEGEAPYVCTLKHDRVSSLRVKNCPVTEKEWEQILVSIFEQEVIEDIQATATVSSESSISLTVRKQVQGITQRLGAITLNCDQNEAIELFQWCEVSLDALAQAKREAASYVAKASEVEAAVNDLQSQLDELVAAKQDDESVLLQKFRDLLNEKKVKIREQQKIIASSAVNGGPSSPQTAQADGQPTRRAGQSRPAKRKAGTSNKPEEEQEDVDVDMVKEEEPEDTDPGQTSEGTASTASENGDEAEPTGARKSARHSGERQPTPPKQKGQEPPPARRSLPFSGKKAAAPAAGGDTDSDDEL